MGFQTIFLIIQKNKVVIVIMEILKLISKWSNIIGLVSELFGAIVLVYGLIITKKEALDLGIPKYTESNNTEYPAVKDLIQQSRNVKIGLFLIFVGFIFQIYYNLSII